MIPPLLLRLKIRDAEHRFGLWLPLFLFWIILLPFILLVLIPLSVTAVFMRRWLRRRIFGIIKYGYVCMCRIKDLRVDIQSEQNTVLVKFY